MRSMWHRLFPLLGILLSFAVFLDTTNAYATGGFYVIGSTAVASVSYTQGSGLNFDVSVQFNGSYNGGEWTTNNGNAGINYFCASDTNGSNLIQPIGSGPSTRFFVNSAYTVTVTCTSSAPNLYKVTIQDTTGSSPFPVVVDWRVNSPNTPSTCPSNTWNSLSAAYVNGNVSFTVNYNNGGTPPSAINAYIPDPQAPTNGTGYSGRLAPVAGSPGYYTGKWAVATQPASARLAAAGNETCYLSVTSSAFGNVADVNPGPTDYGATDGDTGISCGFNPFCYVKAAIKWAFFPTDGDMNQWTNKISSISGHFPINVMVGGVTLVKDATDCAKYEDNVGVTGTLPANCGSADPGISTGPYGQSFNPLDWINHITAVNQPGSWWSKIRAVELMAIWGGAVLVIWSMISANFGGKET